MGSCGGIHAESKHSERIESYEFSRFHNCHVIGFSDLVDLWVITIKKPRILCVRITWRSGGDKVTRVQTADQTARTYECFVYSVVAITRLHVFVVVVVFFFLGGGGICEVRKGMWDFFLDCAFRLLIG